MKKLFSIWLVVLLMLTGFGVWATYSNYLIDDADDFNVSLGKPVKKIVRRTTQPTGGGDAWGDDNNVVEPSLREDSTRGTSKGFFPLYFSGRGPKGGGFGYGK